jgi:gentisate 1,2-dioxygenase
MMDKPEYKNWPISGEEARKKPVEHYKIPREKMLNAVYGKTHPTLIRFYVSNDLVQMGEIILPPCSEGSRCTEPMAHKGDTALYVQHGPVTVYLPETQEAWELQEEEAFFIPGGVKHQIINYTDKVIKVIFAIAPGPQ